MALVVKDRVRETTTTTGTGTVTLAGAVAGFQSFSVIGNGNTTYYTITNNVDWEVGIGTYTSSGTTLSRDTILESSNGGSAVNFGAGTKDVFVTYPAEKAVYYDVSDNVGIGTSSPGSKLTVYGPSGAGINITNATTGTGATNGFQLAGGAGGDAYIWNYSNSFIAVATNNTERMRIDSSGNVGIGTTSPRNPGAGYQGIVLNGSTSGFLDLNTNGTRVLTMFGLTNDAAFANPTATGSMTFYTNNTERMRIDSSGNVGIGTSAAYGGRVNVVPASTPTTVAGANQVQIGEATANTGYRLQLGYLNDATAGYVSSVQSYAGGSAAALILNGAGGNVGIGVTPSAKLDVAGTSRYTFNVANSYTLLTSLNAAGSAFVDAYTNGLSHIWQTSGTERMRIDSSGNVGIGTSGPAKRLEVRGNGSNAAVRLKEDASYGVAWDIDVGSTNQMLFTNNAGSALSYAFINGNVGIGTSSPSSKLEVSTVGSAVDCIASVRAGNAAYFQLWGTSFPNYNGIQSLNSSGSEYWGIGGFGATNGVVFRTNGGTERMRIDSSGNVGIGTSSPQSKMEIRSTSGGSVVNALTLSNYVGASAGTGVALHFDPNGAGSLARAASIQSVQATSGNFADLRFFTANSDTPAERIRVTPGGDVGIGTTSPGVKLDVAGSVRVSNTSSVQFRNAAGSGVAYMTLQSDDNFVVYNAAGAPIQSFTQGATNNAIYGSNANNRMVVDSGTPVTYWTVNGSERMRIDSSGNVGIGTSSPGSRLNVKGGMTWVQNFNGSASSPTEAIDWPVPALNVTSYGDFTLQTMMTFTLPNDGNYFTGDSVWNFRLEQTASSTTSAGVSGMRFAGPGYLMFGAGQTERMRIESGGHVIFGPYASSASSGNVTNIELKNNGGTGDSNLAAMSFHCQGTYGTHLGLRADGYLGAGGWSASAWRWYVYMPSGDMTAAGNVTAYSDPRLKEDVQPISGALDTLRKLDGVRFRWKEQEFLGHSGAYDYGVLADQVQAVLPEIVADSMHEAPEGDRYKTVAYDKLVPVLLEAIKELEARVAQLEEK